MPEFKWETVQTEKLRIWETTSNSLTVYNKICVTDLRGFMYFHFKIVNINITNR